MCCLDSQPESGVDIHMILQMVPTKQLGQRDIAIDIVLKSASHGNNSSLIMPNLCTPQVLVTVLITPPEK